MKISVIVLLFLMPLFCKAQKLPDYGLDRVRITESDKIIQAELEPVSRLPTAKTDVFYFWYSSNSIHMTAGGYSGRLLNGLYSSFYLNRNLKEKGNFKKGLKDGQWRSWNEDGTLLATTTWKRGKNITGLPSSFWMKLQRIWKRRNTNDSLKRS